MTLDEALSTPNIKFFDVGDVPVIEVTRHNYWAFAPGAPRRFGGDSVDRNGGEISRQQFLALLSTWNEDPA